MPVGSMEYPREKNAATGESRLERESLNSRNLPFLLVE